MFTTNIPPRKVRRMMKKQRMLEEKIKNAKQSFSHSGPSGSGFMKPEISCNFGSVPSIGASLNSLVQTTPGVQTTRFGPVIHQSTEIKPSLAEQFKPTFPAFQSSTPSTSSLPQNNKEDKQITVDPNPSESFTNIQNVEINGINPKSPFPKLLIFKGCAKQYCGGVQFLRKSFYYSIYGPLTCLKEQCGDVVKARLWVAGNCVREGQGYTSIEAELDAMYKLFQELRTTNYYIELKDSYMPGKKKTFPPFLSNVDPSLSHIYKVVCLRKRDGSTFVHNIQGAVDYVSSARELLDYIKNHGNTGSKADLFIFNVDKSQRTEIYRACSAVGMKGRPLIGCSDGGVMAYFPEKPWEILQDLLKCGGETIKYRLFPPGSDLESELVGDRRKSTVNDEQGRTNPQQDTSTHQEEIEISPWIAENLIIMEVFNERSWIDCPKEVIFQSVRSCPALEEIIIEKKRDPISKLITGEVLIDRRVVGRATSYIEKLVKERAAEDALKNLRKYCPFIEIKKDYSGLGGGVPQFISKGYKSKENIYRIVDPSEASNEFELKKLFSHFWNSSVEDLFFLDNFTVSERHLVLQLSKEHGFLARHFGHNSICIYKKKTPREIYSKLMDRNSKENEKYKLHLPKEKLKSPVTDESHTQGEANRRDLQSLFDLKQSDNEFSGENSSTQLSLTPQSRIPPFKPNKNMTIIKQNSPSERLETVPSTFSEREPVNSEMGNPNERIEISTEVSRNVEGELWQRRKYSYQDKRTYSAAGFDDGAECLPPKLSHKSKDVRDSMQLRNQIKFEGEQRWQETELNLSTHLDNSSSFSNSGTKKEDSNLDSNTLYNSEVDVWMETESPMPSLSSISTESRKIAQPVNPVKELFKNTNPEPQFIEMGKTSRYLEGTEGCLNQSIEEVSANNRISSDLGSTESSHQHTNNVQSFNQQSNCSNQDKALDLNSIIQQMEKQLKESSSQFKSSSQFNKVEKQFGKEAQTFLSVENRIDRESAGVNRSSREPSRTQNKPHNTENMLENQPPVLSHPFVNTSNFKNTSRQVEQQRNISKNMFTESDSSTMENRIVRESAGVNRQESDKFWNRNVKSFYDQTFMRNSEDHIVQKRREFKQLFDLPESEKGDELKEFEKKSRLDQVEDSFKESHSVKNEKQKLLQLNNEMYSPFEQTNVSAVEGPPYLNSRMRDQSCMSSSRGLGEEPNNYTVYENSGSGAHNMEQQNIEDLPTDSSRHARIPPPPLPPPLLSSLNNDSYLFEECSQERSSRWNEKERSLYQKVQFHNPSHTDILPPPPSPPFKDTDFWKSDRQRGSGYELDERSSYQQQLSFPSPSDRNTNFRSTVLEEEKQVDKEDQQREKGSKFSSLFDFSDTSRADGKQLTPEASGRDRNQPYERGNSSRNYREVKSGASNFSSNREHSQQETHPYWRKDIKVAYDQTKLELNRRGQSNFSERFDVDRSQDTWKSRYQSNHSRSPDRREKKRGHSFSKLNKYAKYPK